MRSQSFAGTGIEFNDIISAAFETGMINSEELDYVVKFEDFWNPKTPKWKAYANFAFSLAVQLHTISCSMEYYWSDRTGGNTITLHE